MMQMAYARLGVAALAALGLHVLVYLSLGYVFPSANKQDSLRTMQVSILPKPQVKAAQVEPAKAQYSNTESPQKPKQAIPEKVQHPVPEVASQQEKPAIKQSEQDVSGSAELIVVPTDVQHTILANVQYPSRARRKGWQGDAELYFKVEKQTVHDVQVFASTGYASLDRAACDGLATVAMLPLADGRYRLPVSFRIQ